ncbi:unnamed protein product [Ophioblennius macclurei]
MSTIQVLLFIQLLLTRYVTQSDQDIEVFCGLDATLPCNIQGNFVSLAWYKMTEGKKGIIKWSGNVTRRYNFPREARFGKNQSLVLPGANPKDSGLYTCMVNANVGGQNQQVNINLTVHECVTQFEKTTVTSGSNLTLYHDKVHDVPLLWSMMGYTAVALAKIALSVMSIWVIHKRSSRQQRSRWSQRLQTSQKTQKTGK